MFSLRDEYLHTDCRGQCWCRYISGDRAITLHHCPPLGKEPETSAVWGKGETASSSPLTPVQVLDHSTGSQLDLPLQSKISVAQPYLCWWLALLTEGGKFNSSISVGLFICHVTKSVSLRVKFIWLYYLSSRNPEKQTKCRQLGTWRFLKYCVFVKKYFSKDSYNIFFYLEEHSFTKGSNLLQHKNIK